MNHIVRAVLTIIVLVAGALFIGVDSASNQSSGTSIASTQSSAQDPDVTLAVLASRSSVNPSFGVTLIDHVPYQYQVLQPQMNNQAKIFFVGVGGLIVVSLCAITAFEVYRRLAPDREQ